MKKYIAHRLLSMAAVLFLLTVVTFFLMHLSPSDPVQMFMAREGLPQDPAYIAAVRAKYGLDQPLWIQYGYWLNGLLNGDLGYSLLYAQPVSVLLAEAVPRTIVLTLVSVLLAAVISFPLALAALLHQNESLDYFIRFLTFLYLAIPTFWLSFILIYVFAVRLHWLPVNPKGPESLILPAAALAVWLTGLYVRRLRAAFLEEYRKNYMTGARMLGLSGKTIFLKYLLPNALPGVISMSGLTIGGLLGGSAVVETIFGWRGMGELMVEAILNQDYQLMQAYILWGAGIFILVNGICDMICLWLNPMLAEKEKS